MNKSQGNARGAGALERVAVALDTDDFDTFRAWCRFFGPRVGTLKVGLEAFIRWGPPAVERAARHGKRVFLDLKLHDIPATVAAAVAAARALGVHLLTVHAAGGSGMLERAAAEAARGDLRLVAVTLLTHLDDAALGELDLPGAAERRVALWARLAAATGCAGVVCSPREARALRAVHPAPFLLITPGVRWGPQPADDQRRISTPGEALAAGADLLVVGRPLTRAADPGRALAELEREIGPESTAPASGSV